MNIRTELVLRGSVAFDLALRTAVASAVTVPGLLWALGDDPRREREHLVFYRELAEARDPDRAFPAPKQAPRVSVLAPPRLLGHGAPREHVRMLRLESEFQAVNPALRASYAGHRENRLAWAQHWRHGDGARPTLAVIHGFGASPYWLNSAFFSLPRLYGQGYDILLYLLPFHGVRQARLAAFSGWGLFAHGFSHFNEAIAHAVHDFRCFMEYLSGEGSSQIAVTGLSLGGYVAALLAAVDERPALVIPNSPVVDVPALARQWFPANLALAAGATLWGIDLDEVEAAMAVHSPLTYPALIAHDRRMIIGGMGDRLAPPEQTRRLWEHWDRPRLHWFPGSHVLHAGKAAYLKEMLALMTALDFIPSE